MFEINEMVIKRMANNIAYRKGHEYYLRNKVENIDIQFKNMKVSNSYKTLISAWVESSWDYDDYKVEVEFDSKNGFTDFHCDCEAFSGYYPQNGVCKHIVAVLLKYIKEEAEKIKFYNPSGIDKLVEGLKLGMVKPGSEKKRLKIEAKYEFESIGRRNSSIELKIGENRLYIVKNIKEFLKIVHLGSGELEFGKGFTFNPSVHGFSKEDRELIELLLEIYEIDERAAFENNYGKPIRFLTGKKAVLIESHLKRFFSIVKGKVLDAVILGNDINEISILEDDMPLDFNIEVSGNNVVLKYDEKPPVPLIDDGSYLFYKNNIYHPSIEQVKIYIPFYNAFISGRKTAIDFDKRDSEKIASYVIPNLRRISRNIKIAEELEKEFYERPLKPLFYFDKDDKSVKCDLRFIYGDVEINPLYEVSERHHEGILIRDAYLEINIQNLLEELGFTKENKSFILRSEDKVLDLLLEGMKRLQELGEVYYSDAFKNIKLYQPSSFVSKIKLNDNDLLEFSFNIDGVDREELKDIFEALKMKRKYYRLKKGGFVSLDNNELRNVGNLIEYLDMRVEDLEEDGVLLQKYNALYVDENLRQNNMMCVEKNKAFREMVSRFREVNEADFKLPYDIDKIMRNYQKIGFKWFKTLSAYGFGGILADEMGLGKTLQAISFMASEAEEGKGPSMVIAPTSLIYNWQDEFEKFAPDLRVLIISGSKSERVEQRKQIVDCDVVITSYPLLRRDIEDYSSLQFNYCFLDEAQQIKNPNSLNAKAAKEIKARAYFALTGTPIENSLTELWSIFDFIMPGYLMNHARFVKRYEIPIVKNKDSNALKELNRHIKPFILRRLKKDVIKELPPKIEHRLLVEMTEEQRKIYMAYLAFAKDEIENEIREKGFQKSRMKILSSLTRLRQICCEPSVFIENYKGESGKAKALEELLEEVLESGHRILLFSQFTTVLRSIAKRLEKMSIEYMYLDGHTKTMERGIMVREFNEGRGEVFLISLKAGGTGLNLTGADVVIHFDPWWNPAVEEQASDRAHRIGQKNTVEVIKLIAKGTIEEKIYNLQEKKKEIIKSVISEDDSNELLFSNLTEKELEGLFRV